MVKRPNIGTSEDWTIIYDDIDYLQSAVLIGHRKATELLLHRLNVPGLNIQFPRCVLRILGSAATLLERYEQAKEHYKEAIKVCADMRFRPELALSRLQFAELLLDHYPNEKSEALEHLDFAIKECREMKMQSALERALRRKDILKA